jgi:hypothetical protein
VEIRLPADNTLDAYRDDPDFIYERPQELGFLARQYLKLRQWLARQFESMLPDRAVAIAFGILPYIIVIAAAVVATRILLKTKLTGLISPENKHHDLDLQELDAGLNDFDFDSRIRQAVEVQDWKTAVRYSYLKTLKKLSDHNLIRWTRDKTNHEYVAEISSSTLHIPFARLTHLFQFIYYGDFTISRDGFELAARQFGQFEALLAQAR